MSLSFNREDTKSAGYRGLFQILFVTLYKFCYNGKGNLEGDEKWVDILKFVPLLWQKRPQ